MNSVFANCWSSRQQRLTIIGLPEGNWITASKGHATLGGPNTTYVFKAGEEAVPLEAAHRF
ncbi:hypothetical protein ACLBR5_00750 [Escherichia coli]